MWHFMFGGVYIYAFAIVFGFKRGVWFEGSAENLLSRFAVAVLTLLWILTLPAILPEDIREAYMNYFRIIRAITVIIVGVLALEVVASIITRRLGILAGKSTSSETLSL